MRRRGAIERSAGAGDERRPGPPPDPPAIPTQDQPLSEVVPGLGAARERALLDAFGSLEGVRSARPDELQQVRGIGPGLAARIASSLAAGMPSGRTS